MAKTKRFKLRLSLPSFQFCRSKNPSSFAHVPPPIATFCFSPINPKAFDIIYPTGPTTTPDHPHFKPLKTISDFSRQSSFDLSDIRSLNSIVVSRQSTFDSKAVSSTLVSRQSSFDTDVKSDLSRLSSFNKKVARCKSLFSNVSSFKSDVFSRQTSFDTEKTQGKVMTKFPSSDSGWFSSCEFEADERENLLTSLDSSYDFGFSTIQERPISPKNRKEDPEKRSIFRRLMPSCAVYEESLTVMKQSSDPYEDFKRSMLEMILERQMFEVEDLEKLLQCFLSLNSPEHHQTIIEAFTEIWQILFCESEAETETS